MRSQYTDTSASIETSWRTEHRNGDETHVVVLDLDGNHHLALAVDFDATGEVLATETIASALTEQEVEAQAEHWVAEHPKGIEDDGGSLGGLLGSG